MSDYVHSFAEYFEVLPATTPELLDTAFRLRFRVYCKEIRLSGFEDWRFPDESESDAYDEHSAQCLLKHRPTSAWAGSVRLILAPNSATDKPFPLEAVVGDRLDKGRLAELPRRQTGEISRLILTSSFRRRRGEANTRYGDVESIRVPTDLDRRHFPHPVLGLMVATVQLSVANGVTHWLAGMEPRLNRLLERFGLNLAPIGPPVEYHGLRRPYLGLVSEVLNNAYRVNRPVWELLSDSGRLFPPPES